MRLRTGGGVPVEVALAKYRAIDDLGFGNGMRENEHFVDE